MRIYHYSICSLIIMACSFSEAITVSPMEASYGITDSSKSVIYTITNQSDKPTAIEVSIFERQFDQETNKEKDVASESLKSDFSIFPKALMIKAGQKKGIRVIYNGKEVPKVEKAYRIVISEKPYKGEVLAPGAYRVLGEFRTPAYVSPATNDSQVEVQSFDEKDGQVIVNLINNGTVHQIPKSMTLVIKDDQNSSIKVSDKENKELIQNFIAKESRQIKIKKPKELKGKVVSASIEAID